MASSKTDLDLIKALRRGDTASFEELLNRYTARVFSLALRLTKNHQDAEEVFQDVFVTVHRKINNFQGKSTFSSWIYRVTTNAAFMKLRKRRQNRSALAEDLKSEVEKILTRTSVENSDLERELARAQLALLLEQAVAKLPEEYRPVFILRDVDGLTSTEVGKILKLSVPAVKSRLHRSRMLLRRELAADYRDFCFQHDEPLKSVGNL